MRSLLCDAASPLSVGEAKIICNPSGESRITLRRVGRASVSVTLDQRELLFVRGPSGRLALVGAADPGGLALVPYDLDRGLGAGAAPLLPGVDRVIRRVSECLVPLGAELVARYPLSGSALEPWEGIMLYRLATGAAPRLYACVSLLVPDADEPSGQIRCERTFSGEGALDRARALVRAQRGASVGAPIARG